MTRVLLLLTASLVAMSTDAVSQKAASASPLVAGPVELQPQPDVITGNVRAFPHIAAGQAVTQAVADKINAALVRADARVKSSALDCQASFKEQQHKSSPDAWQRSIEVGMRGPRFISFTAEDSYYCGGPYPNAGLEMPLVYDLATGSPVNWIKLLPPGAKGKLSNGADGTTTGELVWPAIRREAMRSAEPECKEVWTSYPDMTFAVSLDAQQGALALQPTQFPHAVMNCADGVALDLAALRRLKAAPELIEALEAAHNLQPKESSPAKK